MNVKKCAERKKMHKRDREKLVACHQQRDSEKRERAPRYGSDTIEFDGTQDFEHNQEAYGDDHKDPLSRSSWTVVPATIVVGHRRC